MTQKSSAYTKMFSTLSAVRLVFWILSQSNILCTSLWKPHCAENNNNLSFACNCICVFSLFCNWPDFIKVECFIYQHIQHFIRSKTCFEFNYS